MNTLTYIDIFVGHKKVISASESLINELVHWMIENPVKSNMRLRSNEDRVTSSAASTLDFSQVSI